MGEVAFLTATGSITTTSTTAVSTGFGVQFSARAQSNHVVSMSATVSHSVANGVLNVGIRASFASIPAEEGAVTGSQVGVDVRGSHATATQTFTVSLTVVASQATSPIFYYLHYFVTTAGTLTMTNRTISVWEAT